MSSAFLRARATIFLVTNALAAIALGFAVCLLFAGFFFFGPRYSAPGLAAALFHLVSVTTMALTSRVLREVVWLSLLCTMWLVICIANREAFVWKLPGLILVQGIATICLLNGMLLLGYIIALVTVALKAGGAGRNIWKYNVKEIRQTQGSATHQRWSIDPPNATVATHPLVNNPNYNVPPAMAQFQPHQQQHGWSQPQPHPPPPFYPSASHPVVVNA